MMFDGGSRQAAPALGRSGRFPEPSSRNHSTRPT